MDSEKRFPGGVLALGLISQSSLSKTLESYDFYEQYDETKSYQFGVFEREEKQYQLKTITSSLGIYIVHERVLTEDYQQQLAKYCQCPVCTSNWYSFLLLDIFKMYGWMLTFRIPKFLLYKRSRAFT